MTLVSVTESRGDVTKFEADGRVAVDDRGRRCTEQGPIYSLRFAPVYHNDDPAHENTRFWAYTPSGEFTLGTVNGRVVDGMKVGAEYFVDITPAE